LRAAACSGSVPSRVCEEIDEQITGTIRAYQPWRRRQL
jgi:hypothetical protein